MDKLYDKYAVSKQNRLPVDPEARYFVLRLDSDGCAREAARTYARCVKRVRPNLAAQLLALVDELEAATKEEATQE